MKTKIYHLSAKAVDKSGQTHTVTVVGLYTQKKEVIPHVVPTHVDVVGTRKEAQGFTVFETTQKVRTLSFGASICHPNDEFDETIGVKLAKSRAKKSPIGTVTSENVTMLNEDHAMALVYAELKHITDNIDNYITE